MRFDYVPRIMQALGVEVVFHKVAQRPGKPMWFGTQADGKAVFALPGNPVSTLVCFTRYVLPAIAHGLGAPFVPEALALYDKVLADMERTLTNQPWLSGPEFSLAECAIAPYVLRLHRLGYDFRGRYTVPHEYAVPVKEKEHVAQWKDQQQGKTLFATAAKPLDAALNALDEWTGHLAVAIVLLVIILRLVFLPLTLKSDRDTLIGRKIAPRIRELKAKLASQGILIETNSPADFARFIKEDHARWGKVIKEAGIKGE